MSIKESVDKIEEVLTRGVEKIYPSKEALEKVLRSGRKIRLYQGFDPSMPNLHLGNMVGILKLKQFQDLGHEVIFLVGDFTGMIGDPADRASARKKLTRKQVLANAKNYKGQTSRVLKFLGVNPAKIKYNSEWNLKLSIEDFLDLASHFTASQMWERDMFQERLKRGNEVWLHEFLYPLIQSYDSVAMDVDLEVGGSDQTFNMLCGRTLMKALKNKEKFVLTTKLLVDSKGEKVGKTTGNALFLNASPQDMFGGIMSFPDEVIILGFELLTEVPLQIIKEHERALQMGKVNPMELKKKLGFEIVKMYHSEKDAKNAEKEFERVFQKGETPTHISIYEYQGRKGNIVNILVDSKLAPSKSEAKRLVEQGAVEIDGKVIRDTQRVIRPKEGMIIKVGKRKFLKISANQ